MGSFDDERSFQVSPETEKFLCERLLDENQPISERFRALFSLRNLRGAAPRDALIRGIMHIGLRILCWTETESMNFFVYENFEFEKLTGLGFWNYYIICSHFPSSECNRHVFFVKPCRIKRTMFNVNNPYFSN